MALGEAAFRGGIMVSGEVEKEGGKTHVDPRCSSSHFLPTVPTHAETTGGEVAATARDPKPGMDDTGGNADPFMVALFALEASCFRSTEGDAE